MVDTTPVFTVNHMSGLWTYDDPRFFDRVADEGRTLAAVKPAFVRLARLAA